MAVGNKKMVFKKKFGRLKNHIFKLFFNYTAHFILKGRTKHMFFFISGCLSKSANMGFNKK